MRSAWFPGRPCHQLHQPCAAASTLRTRPSPGTPAARCCAQSAPAARVLEDVKLYKCVVGRPGHEIDDHLARLRILDDGALRSVLAQRADDSYRAWVVQREILPAWSTTQLLPLRMNSARVHPILLLGPARRRAVEAHAFLLMAFCRRCATGKARGEQQNTVGIRMRLGGGQRALPFRFALNSATRDFTNLRRGPRAGMVDGKADRSVAVEPLEFRAVGPLGGRREE